MKLESCNAQGRAALAAVLGDSPTTTTMVHLLHRNLCVAYVLGDAGSPLAAAAFSTIRPRTAVVFGEDAAALWSLLQAVPGWETVNVAGEQAEALRAAMERDLAVPVERRGDMYFVLNGRPADLSHPLVRRLTAEDIELIEEAPPPLQQGRLFGGPVGLLREGIMAGAIDTGTLVATAHTSTLTAGYADIGVVTLESYRRQGIAAAAASLVCRAVQGIGRRPVWNCADDNVASVRLAGKLGFVPIERRVEFTPIRPHARAASAGW
ncbi:MAG TPA: GNAT family N-acetyltransferase [Chloroflexota bacterium]|nr:GNAT family N-acetyltransferase [Chloroflexota bacterium]